MDAPPEIKAGYDVLPLRIGTSCWPRATSETVSFYDQTTEYLGFHNLAFLGDPGRTVRCVTRTEVEANPERLETLLLEASEELDVSALLVFVDLVTSHIFGGDSVAQMDPLVETHIANAILALSERLAPPIKVVVLTPGPFLAKEASAIVLQSAVSAHRVVVIDELGQSTDDAFSTQHYRELVQSLRGRLLAGFQSRVIKQRGWYVPDQTDATIRYSRTYFDARYGERELRHLLRKKMSELSAAQMIDTVLFTSQRMPWLETPLRSAAGQLNLMALDLDSAPDMKRTTRWKKKRRGLLVLPYVDTGTSLASTRRQVQSRFPVQVGPCLSVFATRGTQNGGVRDIQDPFDGSRISFDYLVGVQQEYSERSDTWCLVDKFKAPTTVVPDVPTGPLTSYEFWDLVLSPGVATSREMSPPNHRIPYGVVPNLEGMLDGFGSFLAFRLWTLVKDREGASPGGSIFVHPSGELISTKLAKNINSIFGVPTVGIPRDIIDAISKTDKGSEEMIQLAWDSSDDWAVYLRGASREARLFLLDDFRGSGTTEESLRMLLTGPASGEHGSEPLEVQGACYLLDFGPHQEPTLERFALYGWSRPEVRAAREEVR